MLYDKLKAYSGSGVYPFHMPGHKRVRLNDALPYELDITEIDGFDNLHHPQGCIRETERQAARFYRAGRAFLLINGATGGLLAAVRAMTGRGDKIILARNCHQSVYNATELCGLKPVYYLPDAVSGTDIYGSVNPFLLDMLLDRHPDARLVVITSPTYEGVCSDITLIARVCRKHRVKLLVDEAHGAHFPFHEQFPPSAIESGADAAVVSLHKTLPAPTQTALLLLRPELPEKEFQKQLAVFETSSPSYLLMCGIENGLQYAAFHSFNEYVLRLKDFYQKAKSWKKLRLLYTPDAPVRGHISNYDIGKLVVTAYGTNLSGNVIAQMLRERYRIEVEMASAHYIIAMTSVCDSKEGFYRLFQALSAIDDQAEFSGSKINPSAVLTRLPTQQMIASDAAECCGQELPWGKAAGKISLEYVYAYPPGIPYLVPGEIVSEQLIETINQLCRCGLTVSSTEKTMPQTIRVADL